jgi:hypothetical protein
MVLKTGDIARYVAITEKNQSVYWTHCGLKETKCVLGYRNDALSLSLVDSLTAVAYLDVFANIWLPTIDGFINMQRMSVSQMIPCDFKQSSNAMECDTSCGCKNVSDCECKGHCNNTESVFKLRKPSTDECLTAHRGVVTKHESIYVAPCSKGHASQLFRFLKYNVSHAQLQSTDGGTPCVFVRSSDDTEDGLMFLANDHECTHWTDVRFLRRSVLIDSDDARITSDVIFNTLETDDVLGQLVTLSVDESGSPPYVIASTVSTKPVGFLPRLEFTSRGETSRNDQGEAHIVFGANRPSLSDRVDFSPSKGILKGRNWDVVHSKLGHISSDPTGNWAQLGLSYPTVISKQGFMTVIAKGEELRSFYTNSTSSCMRSCELSEDCKAISTTQSASATRCTHGSESHSEQTFDAFVTFSVNRTMSFPEVVQYTRMHNGQARGTWTRHISNGLINVLTGEPSLVMSQLLVVPAFVYGNGRDKHGMSIQSVCIPTN